MELLNAVALVLLTLFGYSCGRVLFTAQRGLNPGVFDIVLSIALSITAVWARGFLGRWAALGLFILIGLIVGVIITLLQLSSLPQAKKSAAATDHPGTLFGKIRKSLSLYFARVGNFQSRILLSWFYFIILMPFGIIVRLTSDPLAIKAEAHESYWKSVTEKSDSLESARRQY